MPALLSCQNLSKSFGSHPLFEQFSFGINSGERIGMIGPNGMGKSTLLKILAGIENADHGELSVSKGLKTCIVLQDDHFTSDNIETVLIEALNNSHLEDHEKQTQAAIMLGRIGFSEQQKSVGKLSGGWRKRLAIARALIQNPDLLFLDEPTNHLDLEGILWLEAILKSAPFASLIVSHDRFFLERVSTRIVELNRIYPEGHFESFGNYSEFLVQREDFLAGQRHQQDVLANKARREIEWLRRGPKARTTKANARIREAHELIDTLSEVTYRNQQTQRVRIDFTSSDRKTKKLLTTDHIAKSLSGRTLFQNLSFTLSPGIRLGVLGLNGSGKTTLLKILAGQLEADSGVIERADHLRIVYFDQKREQLDLNQTLRRALTPYGDQVIFRDQPLHVATWARRFLFQSDQLEMPISSLSGGERARILIARLMQQPADILILDEPTNDLDIPTLEVLEETLTDFPGAVVLVTHDRYMLDRISTHLLALEDGNGIFYADYDQWESAQKPVKLSNEKTKPPQPIERPQPNKPKKLSYKEQRELDGMEAAILKAEEAVSSLETEMNSAEVVANPKRLQEICSQLKTAQDDVERLYQRWSELSENK